ncbi:MAG: HlyC/CorC family transporter [Bacteroidetes bacterium]|nr:HlyC/CorC family transporter [Bacteroidota bacterium]MBM3425013.1 HlyC/CorC family transporter [Bacteroidota bacterium]
MGENVYLTLFVLSLIGSAFFSGMEQAFLSSNRLRVEVERGKGSLQGKINAFFYRNQSTMIAMMLLGNNISLVIYGITFGHLLIGDTKQLWGVHSEIFVLVMQTILSTLLVLIGAEFFPKAIASINPNRILNIGSIPLAIVFGILYLPTQLILVTSLLLLKITGSKMKSSKKVFSKIDLEHYVDEINSRISPEQELKHEMVILKNALEFSQVKARDCMIPRTEIVAVELEETVQNTLNLFIERGLSKIIVYRGSIDNIIGYVHSFDFFSKPDSIKSILKPIGFVPGVRSGKSLLENFSKQTGNIAVVNDEYGGTAGIITLEDVIEEIFGDIIDEHDKEDWLEQKISDAEYLFSGRVDIDYLKETYDIPLPESDEYDTLAGLIIHHLERIPELNETLELEPNVTLIIEQASERRIEKVRILLT